MKGDTAMIDQSLSRSLVDAAAEALRQAGFVDPDDDTVPTFFPADSGMAEQGARMDVWKPAECAAEVAVAAVLETLAAHCDPVAIGDGSTSQALLSNTELRRLAVEARKEGA